MNSKDRYKILANIVAQKGTDFVDLYAELAKAESAINIMDTQNTMLVSQPVTPNTKVTPETGQNTNNVGI